MGDDCGSTRPQPPPFPKKSTFCKYGPNCEFFDHSRPFFGATKVLGNAICGPWAIYYKKKCMPKRPKSAIFGQNLTVGTSIAPLRLGNCPGSKNRTVKILLHLDYTSPQVSKHFSHVTNTIYKKGQTKIKLVKKKCKTDLRVPKQLLGMYGSQEGELFSTHTRVRARARARRSFFAKSVFAKSTRKYEQEHS